MESVVLLWVEHFEQGRSRVAIVGHLRHLINLVEDKDGVAGACFLDRLDDTTRHGTNIRATMTTDLGLVVETS